MMSLLTPDSKLLSETKEDKESETKIKTEWRSSTELEKQFNAELEKQSNTKLEEQSSREIKKQSNIETKNQSNIETKNQFDAKLEKECEKSSLHLKYLFLIIDSNTLPVYLKHREIIRKYSKSRSDFMALFIRSNPFLDEPMHIDGDTIYFRFPETYEPGILLKTLAAMNFVYHLYSFDFLVRTNLSSFFDYTKMDELYPSLEKRNLIYSIPLVIDRYLNQNIKFPHGACFILSRDLVKVCIDRIAEFDMSIPDDVSFGKFFQDNKYEITDAKLKSYWFDKDNNRVTKERVTEVIKGNYFYYRVRDSNIDRDSDPIICSWLYEILYENN